MTTKRILEICVDDFYSLQTAVLLGADRIELCSALELGGLTPSYSLMKRAAQLPIPVYAMVRPRAGDFDFSSADVALMLEDIDCIRSAGLAGVVLGASKPDGRLDENVLRHLAARATGLGMTLHRAFDLVPDIAEAVEFAISVGFERILTSGGRRSAIQGMEGLRIAQEAACGRIVIMPGAGLNPENVCEFAGFAEVHASCSENVPETECKAAELGFVRGRRISKAKLVGLTTAMKS